jgi:hypothetical protein
VVRPGLTWIARTRASTSDVAVRPQPPVRPVHARDLRRGALCGEREGHALRADPQTRRSQALLEVPGGRGVARRPGSAGAAVGGRDALQRREVVAQAGAGGLRLRGPRHGRAVLRRPSLAAAATGAEAGEHRDRQARHPARHHPAILAASCGRGVDPCGEAGA